MKRFAVIGLGNFGYYTTKTLYEDGNEVIAIDLDKSIIQSIDKYSSQAVVLDATDRKALETLGLEDMDCVIVSTGPNISTSILICLYLGEIGVKKIFAVALDEDHGKILKLVGATDIIQPERDIAYRVSRNLTRPDVMDFLPLSDEFDVVQVYPPNEFVGKSIKTLNLRDTYNVHIIAVKQDDTENYELIPSPDFIIHEHDILIMIGKYQDIQNIKELQ